MEFKDLFFGLVAAEDEASDYPELLLRGYYDHYNLLSAILNGPQFLILGPKGSGKSALIEHLRLRAETDSELFVTRVELTNLHFRGFLQMVPSKEDRPYYPSAWEWLLLLALFASFRQDEGAFSNSNEDYRRTVQSLDLSGYLPRARLDMDDLIKRTSTGKLTVKLPLAEAGIEETRSPKAPNFFSALATLRSVATRFMSDSRHIIVVDGLDTMFIAEPVDWQILTALMVEAASLNRELRDHNTPATIVVLCRNDVFGRLPFPDSNKIRQVRGLEINWYPRSALPSHSPLFRLANKKVAVHYPQIGDVITKFFPPIVSISPRGARKIRIHDYLMELTRYRPRDFLALMSYIRGAARDSGVLREEDIHEGARRYCIQYFVPEIRSELHGLLSENDAFQAIGLVKSMGGSQFHISELEKRAKQDARYANMDLPAVVEQLFTCGAIGNIVPGQKELYYDFSYRNPEIDFNPDRRLVIHNALIRGLNIPRQVVVS